MRLAVPATLAALSLLLLGGIAYEGFAPLDPVVVEVPRIPKRASSPAPLAPAYIPPPEADFADIDARPPFSSARKPLNEPSAANAALSASSDFSLVGVVMDANRAVALLHSRSGNTTTNAVLGDLVSGWRVVKVEATAVTLHANGADAVIALEGPAAVPASSPLVHPPTEIAPPPAAPAPAAPASGPANPAPTPALVQPAPPAPEAAATPPKPGATAATTPKPGHPYIAPEALRGASIDPATGEPVL